MSAPAFTLGIRREKAAARDEGANETFWCDYDCVRELGQGHFGTVHLVNSRASGEASAVKVVEKVVGEEDCRREARFLRELAHPHIVSLRSEFESSTTFFLVLEPVLGDSLDALIQAGTCTDPEARRHVRALLLALDHIHSRRVVHRDIKPSNVLLTARGDVKLADFGLSEQLPPSGVLTEVCGSHDYLAPEMIRTGHGEAGGYSLAVDLWGVGVLVYMLLHGANPFERPTEIETLQAILGAEYAAPACASADADGVIGALLTSDPAARPSASACLRLAWLAPPAASRSSRAAPPKPLAVLSQLLSSAPGSASDLLAGVWSGKAGGRRTQCAA